MYIPCLYTAFNFQTTSSDPTGEAIWLPCVPHKENLRYHLFSRGLRLPSAYLEPSACLTNTNMQLGFPGTHYLTLWYMSRG